MVAHVLAADLRLSVAEPRAVQHIAEETEKTAATCDNIARACGELMQGAGDLSTTVNHFAV